MPFPVEAEAIQGYEEARSVLGSLVTQLIAIVRQILAWVEKVSRQIVTWAGEHPLAMTTAVANIIIWMS